MGPHPAVAAVRLGVRRGLAGLPGGVLVLAACSGGADSLALAAALAFEAPRRGVRGGGVTVDHGLQPGSAAQAARTAAVMTALGLDPVRCVRASVGGRGTGYPGPEAAARSARYAAIDAAVDELGATAVMLGHTMDDQAETVLLGLARGSGARSLAGMAPAGIGPAGAGQPGSRYLRPLLGLRRQTTRAACEAAGLQPWDDPHNCDPSYARVRVREQILPLMERLLGPGVTEALARTADQLRADADALDQLAGRLLDPGGDLDVTELAALPAAIRTRVLKAAAIAAGARSGALTAAHVADMDALVTKWHGQRWSDLPGGLRCVRSGGQLRFTGQA